MTDRLTDDQIRAALQARQPRHAPHDLRTAILSEIASAGQDRRAPRWFGVPTSTVRLAWLLALIGLIATIAFATLTAGSRPPTLTSVVVASPVVSGPPSDAPSASVRPSADASPTPGDDLATAADAVRTYETALAARDFATAWDLRSPASRAGLTLEAFSAERSQFLASTKGEFTLRPGTQDAAQVGQWLQAGVTDGIDAQRAVLIEVDFPQLAGNNAGYEVFLVSPDAAGQWRLWQVR